MSARNGTMAAVLVGAIAMMSARGEVLLVDFGTSNSYRGVSVANPDPLGRTWNGLAPWESLDNMRNTSNQATHYDLAITTPLATDSYNGPAGVTSDPPTPSEITATAIDAAALGDLGVTNAVFEYFAAPSGDKGKFTLSNLDPTKRYSLTFFGSRKYPNGEMAGSDDTRTTVYSVTDSNGVVLASTNLRVGVFGDHNSNTVATLAGLAPDLRNRIFVEFHGLTSTNSGYLNCLKIEVLDPPAPPPADQSIFIDLGNDISYRGASVANPDVNGRYWNSVHSSLFYEDLLDQSNTATAVDFGFDAGSPDSYNGPAGVTSDPPTPSELAATAFDAAALGALGVTNAVFDYYVDASFQIQGLNPFRTYSLTFFGSHKFSTDDATVYEVYTDSAYTQLVARASLNVQVPGSPSLHNSNTVVTITNLAPQAGDILFVKVSGNAGGSGYLNALRIDVHVPDLTYEEWSTNYPSLGGRQADDDLDGLSNLAEFGLGGNPTNDADTGYAPSFTMASSGGSNVLRYVYARRSGDSGLTYHLETSTNLPANLWADTGYTEAPTAGVLNPQFESVTNLIWSAGPNAAARLVVQDF
jgi:hypothetical protein